MREFLLGTMRGQRDAAPESLRSLWQSIALPGALLGSSVTPIAIAAAPTTLGSVAFSGGIRLAAAVSAAVQLVVAARAAFRPAGTRLINVTVVASGMVIGLALTRLAFVEPLSALALVAAHGLLNGLVGNRPFACTAFGVTLGAAAAMVCVSPMPIATDLALHIERTYAGVPVSPLWLPLNRAVVVAAMSIIAGGALIVAPSRVRRWRAAIQRYGALERLVRGRKHLEAGQGARAILTLTDSHWALIGIAAVEWQLVRIMTVRTGTADGRWRAIVQTLHDATIPLGHSDNPIARAARSAETVPIARPAEMLHGMWRSLPADGFPSSGASPWHGWAIPFGPDEARGVLFALSGDRDADLGSLRDLAAALALLRAAAPVRS